MAPIAGFVGGWYSGANPVSAVETLVNLFPSAVETPGGAVTAELLPTPGCRAFATASVSGARGAWAGDGRCFVVFGDSLFEVTVDGVATLRSTMANDGRPVTFSTNGDAGNQVLITSGGSAYCYDLTANTLTLVLSGGEVVPVSGKGLRQAQPGLAAKASAKLTLLSGAEKQEVELKPAGDKLEATGSGLDPVLAVFSAAQRSLAQADDGGWEDFQIAGMGASGPWVTAAIGVLMIALKALIH